MATNAAKTAALMEQMPEADDDALEARLTESGITKSEAHELIVFVPLAFGRYAFRNSGATFSSYFSLVRDGRIVARLPLSREPAFNSGWEAAEEFYANPGGRHYLAIAGRSGEIRGINKALKQGSKIENLLFGDPLVMLPLRKASIWQIAKRVFAPCAEALLQKPWSILA